ncbi:hypothetical protein IFM89_039670 [Coptis chinensis]|uniref:Fungal lipase-type domain-containing protein n=1 Tax=Coptis chinensis TaxID=261450 RepID=A0A835LAF0_9MAGN|nr:hypothetical protein IFM89_039670 [Coptis chinensis]
MASRVGGGGESRRYLIVRPEGGGITDLFNSFSFSSSSDSLAKFIVTGEDNDRDNRSIADDDDHRWVIVVSVIVRKIISVLGKPMEWCGYFVEFILNLLSHNGQLLGLIHNFLRGKVVIPHRDSDTFISAIGHLDGRVDLCDDNILTRIDYVIRDSEVSVSQIGDRDLMDFCMMASKLAYENAKVIKNIVVHHWKMHFVEFFNGWNDFQKERSTQVFILCDKPRDANLILISFRGTEPFDADDWSTDFDYSWYEIPKLGKVHMGFLEALGLGNRSKVSTFHNHLRVGGLNLKSKLPESEVGSDNGLSTTTCDSNGTEPVISSDLKDEVHLRDTEEPTGKEKVPVMGEMTAFYGVRSKLKSLLEENKNAKFVVTGHSLGGALAILFPAVLLLHEEKEMMQRLLGVYTFGQPRVGDRKLGRFMEAHLNDPKPKYFRLVYCNDLVPRLPYDNKTFLYKHFGECLYYNSRYIEKEVWEEPNKNYFGLIYLIPEYINAMWELIRSLTMGYTCGKDYKEGWFRVLLRMLGLAIPGISAHCPTDYVNSVRLGKEQVHVSCS